jgi:hypothetical protein
MARRVKVGHPERQKEQTMTEPKPPKKRVVSKSEYVRHRITKAWWRTSGLVGIVSGVVIGVIFGMGQIWYMGSQLMNSTSGITSIVLGGLMVGLIVYMIASGLYLQGTEYWKKAGQLEDVELLKHANVGQLPAEETLLRASAEPTEGQEKVLLRAAMAGAETPPEQLLRPGNLTN